MIKVRDYIPGENDDALKEVVDSAVAKIRKIYRPTKSALERKKKIAPKLPRLIAEFDGHIVGTTQYQIDSDRIHIIGLETHQQFIKRGIARSIITRLEEIARSRGICWLSLYTIVETGNVVIFEKLGFRSLLRKKAEGLESDLYPELTEVYMEKDLS